MDRKLQKLRANLVPNLSYYENNYKGKESVYIQSICLCIDIKRVAVYSYHTLKKFCKMVPKYNAF